MSRVIKLIKYSLFQFKICCFYGRNYEIFMLHVVHNNCLLCTNLEYVMLLPNTFILYLFTHNLN